MKVTEGFEFEVCIGKAIKQIFSKQAVERMLEEFKKQKSKTGKPKREEVKDMAKTRTKKSYREAARKAVATRKKNARALARNWAKPN